MDHEQQQTPESVLEAPEKQIKCQTESAKKYEKNTQTKTLETIIETDRPTFEMSKSTNLKTTQPKTAQNHKKTIEITYRSSKNWKNL